MYTKRWVVASICVSVSMAVPVSCRKGLQMGLNFERDPDSRRRATDRKIDFGGWILFLLSAVCFVIASIGDFWPMLGSIFFLVACLVFLLPYFRK